jgi:hypothetical protein
MLKRTSKGNGVGTEVSLAALMKTVVDARTRLTRAREKLRSIEEKVRGSGRGDYERQRDQALGDYIDAMGKARAARTRLLNQLRQRAA